MPPFDQARSQFRPLRRLIAIGVVAMVAVLAVTALRAGGDATPEARARSGGTGAGGTKFQVIEQNAPGTPMATKGAP